MTRCLSWELSGGTSGSLRVPQAWVSDHGESHIKAPYLIFKNGVWDHAYFLFTQKRGCCLSDRRAKFKSSKICSEP